MKAEDMSDGKDRYHHPDFREKLSILRGLIDSEHVPPRVKEASFRLSDLQKNLFNFVGDPGPALRTADFCPGLYASDFLCELIAAYRALDWPKVLVLIHDAIPLDEQRKWG